MVDGVFGANGVVVLEDVAKMESSYEPEFVTSHLQHTAVNYAQANNLKLENANRNHVLYGPTGAHGHLVPQPENVHALLSERKSLQKAVRASHKRLKVASSVKATGRDGGFGARVSLPPLVEMG